MKYAAAILAIAIATTAHASPRSDLAARLAYAVVTASAAPTPTPQPTPAGDVCPECEGTGKLGDGTVFVTCPACNGTGKKTKAEPAEKLKAAVEAAAPPAVVARPPVRRMTSTRWSVNGQSYRSVSAASVANHLRNEHGIDPSGYTREELLTIHDNAHSGASCPTGTCPNAR